MKILKQLCLVCFSIFTIGACVSHRPDISNIQGNNELPSVIDRVKDSIVLLSASVNEDPNINANQNAMCSGAVLELQYIITNFHCIYKQKFIRVYFWKKDEWNEYEVNVVGTDPLADLALLEVIDRDEITPHLTFAKEQPKTGEDVFAMGHPMGMAWTVTKGIVSSTDRFARHPFIKAIQTDAAINVGNSGGPLLNMKGEIVGLNALIISKVKENAGIGLAIRGDLVQDSYKIMIAKGNVHRPAIGVSIAPLSTESQRNVVLKSHSTKLKKEQIPNTFGLFVQPFENMPEQIKPWDTIIAIEGQPINNSVDLAEVLIKFDIGQTITILIIRNRQFRNVSVKLRQFEVPIDKMYNRGNL